MKRNTFFLALVFLLLQLTIANAQERNSKWINIVGGLNTPFIIYQNTYGNPEFEYFPTTGLTGGAGLIYFRNSEWVANGSLLITKIGQNYRGVQSGGNAERRVKLYYLEVPLLAMKNVIHIKTPVYISFGPDFFFLLSAKQEYQRTGGAPLVNQEGMAEGKITKRFNPVDVSLNFALSQFYKLKFKYNKKSNTKLFASLNTSIGLTDINRDKWRIPQPDGSYSGSHNLYMGFKIGLMINAFKDRSLNSSFY